MLFNLCTWMQVLWCSSMSLQDPFSELLTGTSGTHSAWTNCQSLYTYRRYAEAFTVILNFGHIATLAWLCSVVSSSTVLQNNLLSQTTLLVLLNQLGHEILLVSHMFDHVSQ